MKLWRVETSGGPTFFATEGFLVVADTEDAAKEQAIKEAQVAHLRALEGVRRAQDPEPTPKPIDSYLPVRVALLCEDLAQPWAMYWKEASQVKGRLRKK